MFRNAGRRHRNVQMKEEPTASHQPFFTKSPQSLIQRKNENAFFQTKLSIGEPNDKYEKEADAVANAVVNKNQSTPALQQMAHPGHSVGKEISSIQRIATPLEDEKLSTNDARMAKDKEIQEKPDAEQMTAPEKKEEEMIQHKADGTTATASPSLSSRIENSSGKGQHLPATTLRDMGSSFGVDFSHVNIHTGDDAVEMNKELHAQAFTHGSDIYFNSGKYNPESSGGKQLLAHELTHVIQQEKNHLRRQPTPANAPAQPLPKFDFPISVGFFKNFDATYMPDSPKPQEGTFTVIHTIFIKFDDKLDDKKKEDFKKDFQKNVPDLWQNKFLFVLNDPDFTPYTAHVKIEIEFTDDPKAAHTIMEVKDFPKDFRSNVESRTNEDFPSLSHVAHLDIDDASKEENEKRNTGKSIIDPVLVQHVGNFDFDSAEINSDCVDGIKKVEDAVDKLPNDSDTDEISFSNSIHYIGRASPEGNKWYNINLSKKRALAVKKRVEDDKPKAKAIPSDVTGEGAEKTQNEAEKENYRRVNVLVFPMTPFSKAKKREHNVAAHEFGHMIGLGDEYSEKGDKKYEKKVEGDRPSHYEDVKSIMGKDIADELSMNQSSSMMSFGSDIKKGHYAYFLKAIRDLTGKNGWNIK